MSFKEIREVPTNHQIVIQLSNNFSSDEKILVTVESVSNRKSKMALMRKAVKDYQFKDDMNMVCEDFTPIDGEAF